MNFADRLRHLVIERNMSAADIARKMGINSRTMYRWWSGETQPNRPDLLKLAEALGIPISQLLDEQDVKPEPRKLTFKDAIKVLESAHEELLTLREFVKLDDVPDSDKQKRIELATQIVTLPIETLEKIAQSLPDGSVFSAEEMNVINDYSKRASGSAVINDIIEAILKLSFEEQNDLRIKLGLQPEDIRPRVKHPTSKLHPIKKK